MLVVGPDRNGLTLRVEGARASVHTGPRPPGATHLDATVATIAPGRINAHTHIYSGLAPLGMPAPDPAPQNFVQILERVWWRLDRALDAASLRASARLYVAEALLYGTTTLIDHHESPRFIDGSLDVLADACDEFGIRALLCYGATERNDGRAEAQAGLAECRRFLTRNLGPRLRGAVALHASFTVGDDTVREAGRLCDALGAIMHVHMAEDGADVDDAKRRGHDGPLQRLIALGALPRGSILAHGVHLSADEVRAADEAGAWFVQNPRSNHGNGVGYPAALRHATRVGLGTDGYPANMPDEIAALREHATAHDDDPATVDARIDGARDLVAQRFGDRFVLPDPTADAIADLVVVEPDGSIRHTVVGGAVVVRDATVCNGDLAEIRANAQAQAEGLWARMEAL